MPRMPWLASLIAVTTLALAPSLASAAPPSCTKTYSGSGPWSTAASWTGGTVPTTGDVVCWGAGSTLTVDVGVAPQVIFGAGSGTLAFTINGSVTASASAPGQGPIAAITMGSGTLWVSAGVTLSVVDLTMTGTASTRGTINGTTGAVLDVTGTVSISGASLSSVAITQSGATAGAGDGGVHIPAGGTGAAGTGGSPYLYSSSITSNRPVTIGNTALDLNSSTITTTSTTTLASGYDNTGSGSYYSTLSTGGLITSGATTTLLGISLQITGSSSSIAGTVHVGGIGASVGGTLALPSSAAIVVDSVGGGTSTWAGTLTGTAPGNAGTLTLKQNSMTFTGTVSDIDLTLANNGATVPYTTLTPTTATAFHPHALNVNGGTLYVTGGNTIVADALTMQGFNTTSRGSISGGGTSGTSTTTLNVAGPISILGGQISSIIVNQTAGGALTFGTGAGAGTGTGAPALSSAAINNGNGPITINNTALYLYFSSITTTATTTLAAGYDNTAIPPASNTYYSTLTTGGLITSGTSTTLPGISLQLTGSSSSIAGTVHLGGLGSSTNGALALPSTAAIIIDSTGGGTPSWGGTLTGAAPGNAGTLTLKQNTTTFTGTVSDIDLTLTSTTNGSPSATVTPTTATAFHPHALNVNGGTLTVTGGNTIVADALTMQGFNTTSRGTINGGGTSGGSTTTLNVAGPISILGGQISSIIVNQTGGSALTFGGGPGAGTGNGAPSLYSAAINNGDGPITITNTALYLYFSTVSTTATTTLASGYDNTGSNSYYSSLTTGGLITSGTSTALPGISLQLTGSSSSIAGTVHLGGLGSSTNGALALPSTAAIIVDSTGFGSPSWAGTLTGAAPGNAGTLTFKQTSTAFTGTVSDIDLTLTNTTNGSPSVTVTPATSTAFHPRALSVNGGNLYITSGATITADTLTMQGVNTTSRGTINGGGSGTHLNVAGPISILGGVIQSLVVTQTSSGALTFDSGVNAGTGAGAPYISGSTIDNGSGPVTIKNPALDLYSATITTTGTVSFAPGYDGSASGSYYSHLIAAGFQSVGGADLAGVTLPSTLDFTPTGGTTTLRSGTAASGDWFIRPGATLVAIGGIGGRVTNQGGTVQLGTQGSQTPVTVTFGNGYAQTSGTLAIDVPSPLGIDKLVQSGGQPASLTGGTIDVTFPTSYRPDNAFDRIPVDGTGAPNGTATATGVTVTSTQITGRRQLVVDNKGLGTTATKSLHLTFPSATPLSPTLTGVPGDTLASITIGAPADDGGSPILHYTVSCVPDCGPSAPGATGVVTSFTVTATAAGHAIVLHGLSNDQGYTFQVVAQNANGNTDPSSPVTLTPSHLPVGSLILLPTSLFVTGSSASFTATCGTDVYAPIASCSVVAKSGATVIAGPATKNLSDFTIPVTVKVTAKGIKAAAATGGVVATVTATITLADHRVLKAVGQIVITKKKVKKVVVPSSILFASGSSTIGAAGKTYLTKLGKKLKGARSVTCTGYTDSDGDAAANYTLGLNRAKAVCAQLKKTMGAKVKYLVGSGGETHPVASNATDAGKVANRRVELSVS